METKNNIDSLGIKEAVKYLQARGYVILEKDYKSKYGQMDIIALSDADTLIFVQVKATDDIKQGLQEAAITVQQRKINEQIAQDYLLKLNDNNYHTLRFDSISLCIDNQQPVNLRHIKGAFTRQFN